MAEITNLSVALDFLQRHPGTETAQMAVGELVSEINRLRALVVRYADQAGITADEIRRVHNV